MERPRNAQLDAILATVDEIRAAEEHARNLRERLSAQSHALAEIEDKPARIASAVYAYWFAPEAKASDLTFGAIGQNHPSKLLKYVGAQPTGVHCDRCKAELEIGSREQMKQVLSRSDGRAHYAEGYGGLCGECREAIFEARREEHEHKVELLHARCAEIAAMDYADYLETQDWAYQRARYLEFLLDATKALGCETCGAERHLGLYHKSQPGRGMFDALILLCQSCMTPLMAAGRLAGEARERNRVSEALVSRLIAQHQDR
jgi:hypothetical protein